MMSKEDIQRLRDRMQERANMLDKEMQESCVPTPKVAGELIREVGIKAKAVCSCDPKRYGTTTSEKGEVTCNKCKGVRK